MSVSTTVRNADLTHLVGLLKTQQLQKLDTVVPAKNIVARGGVLHIAGMGTAVADTLDAFVDDRTPGQFLPTAIMDGQIADKLGIPVAYLRRLRAERPDMYDANVNGWLHGRTKRNADGTVETTAAADIRRFLVRTFIGEAGEQGIGRALLSDSFKASMDHLDVLLGALDGIKRSGRDVKIDSADLTETRMVVRVYCPDIAALAPTLFDGYRSPIGGLDLADLQGRYGPQHLGWDPAKGQTPPVVFAGFELTNSETGGGAFTITPRIVALVCKNGMKLTKDLMRKVHLGSRMDEGQVRWSDETQRMNVELVAAQAADVVTTCLSQEYLDGAVAGIEAKAGHVIVKPIAEAVELVVKKMRYSEEAAETILDHFIRGGQMTSGGILQAVTSAAQTRPADEAFDMETSALDALEFAATL